jgi:SAM-dependent methyltransferase
MMRFTWDEQAVKWFIDASIYTGFHKALAQKILPYLEESDTLCDLGCGLGRLDLELAPYVSNLTAIDINENAVRVLRRDAENAGLRNLQVQHGDALLSIESCDVLLSSFFGRLNTLGSLKHCRRKLIRITGGSTNSGLYPQRYRIDKKHIESTMRDELASLGISYEQEIHTMEFGQPLRTRHDAGLYISHHAPEATEEEIDDFLNQHLERTGRDDFPFFLPNQKEINIFIISP